MGKSARVIGRQTGEWEAPDGGGWWRLVTTWAEVDGRAECVGIELRSFDAPGDPGAAVKTGDDVRPVKAGEVRAVRAEVLRRVTMGYAEEHRAEWVKHLSDGGAFAGHPDVEGRRADQQMFATPQGRRFADEDGAPLPVDVALARVASAYVDAWRSGRSDPTTAVAESLDLSKSGAAKRVARARKAGMLTPGAKGRPGGELTPKARELLAR